MTNGVTPADLEKVKEQQIRKLEVDLKQNQYWMNSLYEAYYLGNPATEILNRENQVRNLSSKIIQDAAKKYIDFSRYIRVVLKPDEKTLKPF
ncbi:MAG: hypothetical protein IPP93_09955 [Chitinophagaceae bacterium]|nr:hypothetical protein [Chitinophagaceae bacterium]